jgi:hypothetical protein
MITRTVKQIKMVTIKQPEYYADGGFGFRGWVKENVYYTGPYTNKEDIENKLQMAKEHWAEEKKRRDLCPKEVEIEMITWWETIEE